MFYIYLPHSKHVKHWERIHWYSIFSKFCRVTIQGLYLRTLCPISTFLMLKWRIFLHNRFNVYRPLFIYINHPTLVCFFACTVFGKHFARKQIRIPNKFLLNLFWDIKVVPKVPDWKNNSDQTYSCPRNWRLSASWGPNSGAPWNPSNHHNTILLRSWSLSVIRGYGQTLH